MTTNLVGRFKSHNELGMKGWTKNFRPWKIIHTEEFVMKADALKREKYLKTGVGRSLTKSLLKGMD